jgi:cytochrome c
MFDTMTMTKILGGVCGTLLVFLLGSWAAEEIFKNRYAEHGGDHGEEVVQAYTIDTGTAEPAEGEGETVDFAALLAAADPAAGEKVFAKCSACHKVDGTDGTGPHLNGVVDRPKASIAGFGYSEVLVGMAGDAWTTDNLNAFIENPKGYAPGTKMSFNGLPKVEDRANLLAYLATTAP